MKTTAIAALAALGLFACGGPLEGEPEPGAPVASTSQGLETLAPVATTQVGGSGTVLNAVPQLTGADIVVSPLDQLELARIRKPDFSDNRVTDVPGREGGPGSCH